MRVQFLFSIQLHCTITQHRYFSPSLNFVAVQSTWPGYLNWNDSSNAYIPYRTPWSFLLSITSESFLKTNLQKSCCIHQYHNFQQRHRRFSAHQRFQCWSPYGGAANHGSSPYSGSISRHQRSRSCWQAQSIGLRNGTCELPACRRVHTPTLDEDKRCYPCRVVYYHPGKDYATVNYEKRELYAVELVSMRNRAWHYIDDAHKSKWGEDRYDPTAYFCRFLYFKDILLGLGSGPTAPTAYVCEYLAPNNDICLHRKGPCRQSTTIWLFKVMFHRTIGSGETEVIDMLKLNFIVIGYHTCLRGNLKSWECEDSSHEIDLFNLAQPFIVVCLSLWVVIYSIKGVTYSSSGARILLETLSPL